MTGREEMHAAVESRDMDAVLTLVNRNPRSLRYLVGLMYRPDEEVRRVGARAIALASRDHQRIVELCRDTQAEVGPRTWTRDELHER